MTYYVWILIAYWGSCGGGSCATSSTLLIDNISTKEECQRLYSIVYPMRYEFTGKCVQVEKVR